MSCEQKFLYKINQFVPSGSEENFFYGTLVHEVLDRAYTKGKPLFGKRLDNFIYGFIDELKEKGNLDWAKDQTIEYYVTVVSVVMEEYFDYYDSDFDDLEFTKVEEVFEQYFNGIKITGKIDARFLKSKTKRSKKKVKWLMEHKTKTRYSEDGVTDMLPMDFQNQYYITADQMESGERAYGVLYNIIRRPSIKPYSNESLVKFAKRLKKDVQDRPDFYFNRWECPYTDETIDEFQEDLTHIFNNLKRVFIDKERPIIKNRFSCYPANFPCGYLEACRDASTESLTKLTDLHPEL